MDFDPSLQREEALWKAYAPTNIQERDGDIIITIPYQKQLHQEDMAPDTTAAQQSYDLIVRAYEPNIIRLFTTMSGDEMTEQDDMLQFAPGVKRVPLSIKDNGGIVVISKASPTGGGLEGAGQKASPTGGGLEGAGGLVGTIDLSAPRLDHWSDLLPAPQPAPFITFYPDGDETKGIALSDDHFSPPRYDALPLGFVSLPLTPSCRGGESAAQKASPTGGGLEGAERATISFRCEADECFVGTGERFRKMDLSGQTFQLKNQDGQGVNNRRCYKNIPFYLSSRMYGAFFHTSDYCKLSLADHSTRSVQFLNDHATIDVFLIGGKTPEKILRGYRMLTGFPQMPPLWSFGIWMSRMTYFSADEVDAICDRLRHEHYPCDVIHLDTGWFRTDWLCEWRFNPERFPDPKAFIQRLKNNGFKVSLWQLPYVAQGAEQLEEAKVNRYISQASPLQTSPCRGGLQKRNYNNYRLAYPDRYDLLKLFSKNNKKEPTEAENILWQVLRGKGLGQKFRRQHIIGDYIADFVCLSCSLVIEVDSGYHQDAKQQEIDAIRTEYLEYVGFSVLRFTNEEILQDLDSVKARIITALSTPSTGGGQGEASSNFSTLDYAGTIDFTYPAATDWYKNQLLKPLLDMGVKCIKTDFGENIHMDHQYHGMAPERLNNIYALLYQRAAYEITKEVTGDGIVWARSAWAGCQRYPLHWGGDSESSWAGMAGSLKGGLHFGLSGFAFWSHDVPGFHSTPDFMNSPLDEQVYVRWTQFGVFSSHMRYHGTCKREPWHYPAIAPIVKRWWQLRYRLLPYITEQAEQCCRTGYPMVRALLMHHPHDRQVWHIDDEYYFGSEFLVCPVINGNNRRDIYLPPASLPPTPSCRGGESTAQKASPTGGGLEGADWVNFFTGERLQGGRWYYDVEVPLDHMPVFVRPGSLIRLYPNEVDSTDDMDMSKAITIEITKDYNGLSL